MKHNSERSEQIALVKWADYRYDLRELLLKTNNEGKRTPAQGWMLKQMGLRVGASDLFLTVAIEPWHGLWIEMKQNRKYTPSEKKSKTWVDQQLFLDRMLRQGYAGQFCYGWDHGMNTILKYLAGTWNDEF